MKIIFCFLLLIQISYAATNDQSTFQFNSVNQKSDLTTEYPHLNQYLSKEDKSNFKLGLGIIPVQLSNSRAMGGLSIFQLHSKFWMFDWEILNASYSQTYSGTGINKLNLFTFRSAPKISIGNILSIGVLAGIEFISYPDISSRLFKGQLFTPIEPFSTSGAIYGFILSETFKVSLFENEIKVNQVFYKQTYKTNGTKNDWSYYYLEPALNKSQATISASNVMQLEISFLY